MTEQLIVIWSFLGIALAVFMLMGVYEYVDCNYICRHCNEKLMNAFDYMAHDGLCDDCRKGVDR